MKEYPKIKGIDYPNRTEFRIVVVEKDPLFGEEFERYYQEKVPFSDYYLDFDLTFISPKSLIFKAYKNRIKNKCFKKYSQRKIEILNECRNIMGRLK